MRSALQNPTFLPPCILLKERQQPHVAHGWAMLAVATLDRAAMAAAVLPFLAAAAAVWLG